MTETQQYVMTKACLSEKIQIHQNSQDTIAGSESPQTPLFSFLSVFFLFFMVVILVSCCIVISRWKTEKKKRETKGIC
jgi:ABC-type Na+ efflux pump permease subunit